MNITIIILIILSGSTYVLADLKNNQPLRYVAKPLTTILVILLAFLQDQGGFDLYKTLIISGLLLSLCGDVFLMLQSDKFTAGLGSFFVAHLFFIFAFASDFGPYFGLGLLLPAAVYAVVFLWIILPKTGKLLIPVIVYAVVLLVFLWQATGRFYYLAGTSALLTFVGAILFVTSDSILGYTRFVRNRRISAFLIHSTYWSAQVFLALSI